MASSLYIEADIQLLGMSFSVDPDNPTTATINFGVTSVAVGLWPVLITSSGLSVFPPLLRRGFFIALH